MKNIIIAAIAAISIASGTAAQTLWVDRNNLGQSASTSMVLNAYAVGDCAITRVSPESAADGERQKGSGRWETATGGGPRSGESRQQLMTPRGGLLLISPDDRSVSREFGRTYPKTRGVPYTFEVITRNGWLIVKSRALRKQILKMPEEDSTKLFPEAVMYHSFVEAIKTDFPNLGKRCGI